MSVTLLQGDCLELLPTLEDNSIDLIATDPPYYKVKGDAWDRQWDTPALFLAWLDTVLEQMARVLKPNGSLYLFASPKMAARVEVTVGQRLNVLNRICWAKGGGDAKHGGKWAAANKESLRNYFPESEYIIFAEHYGADNIAKGEAGYAAKCDELRGFIFEPLRAYLDGERKRAGISYQQVNNIIGKPVAGGGMATHYFSDPLTLKHSQWALPTKEHYEAMREGFSRLNHGGEYLRREYEELRREYEYLRREYEELRRPFSVTADVPYTDVWTFPTVQACAGKHPCEKPESLLSHIIKASSKEGSTVLDAFMGSGVTGACCVKLNRNFIGIEKDEKYFEQSKRRIELAQAQPALEFAK